MMEEKNGFFSTFRYLPKGLNIKIKENRNLMFSLIFIICGLIGYYLVFKESDIVIRKLYNKDFTISIRAYCVEEGFLDTFYEKEVYLIKKNSDSIEVKLNRSEYVSIFIYLDTICFNGMEKEIFVLSNLDAGFTLVDIDSLKVIKDEFIKGRVIKRKKWNYEEVFPQEYVKKYKLNEKGW